MSLQSVVNILGTYAHGNSMSYDMCNPLRLNYATPPSAAPVADERDVAVSVHPDTQPVHFCPKSR